MAHEIESMAYTNQVPWHGLGVQVKDTMSVVEMLKAAKLNWKIHKVPMFAESLDSPEEDLIPIPEHYALIRDSDDKVLDVVGKQYKPIQNIESFKFFNEFVRSGKAKMETAGSLRGGRYVWGLANLGHSFKLTGNDEVKGYLLVASPHEAGKALIIKFTTIRVVCNNTLTLALKTGGTEFRMAHRCEFDDSMRSKAKDVLGIAHDQMEEFEKNAKRLKKLNLKHKDILSVLANVYQPDINLKKLVDDFDGLASPSLKKVIDVLENAPGADPETAWGVLNAVTYYADHVASRSADKRLTNAWFGKTSHHKELVLNNLLRMTA